MLVVDPNSDAILDANPAAEALYRTARADLLQQAASTVIALKWDGSGNSISAGGNPLVRSVDHGGRATATRLTGDDAYLITVAPEQAVETDTEVHRLTWALEAYARSAKALIRSTTLSEMAQRVCQAIVEHHDYALATIVLAGPLSGQEIRFIARAGSAVGYLDGLEVSLDPTVPEGQGPTGRAIRSGQPLVMDDCLRNPIFQMWRDRAIRFGIRSSATVPFTHEGHVVGAVMVYAAKPRAFSEREVEIFEELGEELAFAISVLQDRERLELEQKARSEAEAQVRARQSEIARIARALTIGEFASSIAHEITQPLAAVITNVETALRFMSQAVPNLDMTKAALERALRDADRAHHVIRQTRSFVAREEQAFLDCDANEIVSTVTDFLAADMKAADVRVAFHPGEGLPLIHCNAVQMQQVLINLMVNAKEAMQDIRERPKILEIRTTLEDTGTVLFQVIDNGEGMSEETSRHVFEPLYTSKKSGMGLGLSISRSIVEAHGGRLWCEPHAPTGTAFFVRLPGLQNVESDGEH